MEVAFIVNPGSTSRKYALYKDTVCVTKFFCEATGTGFCMSVVAHGVKVVEKELTATEFNNAATHAMEYALESGQLDSVQDITHVAVRVVAPGTFFTKHRVIDAEYISQLKKVEDVAPLHIPDLISEIESIQKTLPDTRLFAVSDSAFHTTIPEYINTVSIPRVDAREFDIRRFGYHGLSMSSVSRRLKAQFGEVPERTIVCHVGGGVSIAALRNGESVSTSMGYSPVSGLIMGSRGGDITAGVTAALTVFKKLRGKKLYEYLYKESGFKGVAGVSDLRLVLERNASGDADAKLAVDMFVHEFHSWIGAHVATLGGVDAIVLTATASERNPALRALLLSGLEVFGIEVDEEKNNECIGREGMIQKEGQSVKIAVMKTDEMGEIDRVVTSLHR